MTITTVVLAVRKKATWTELLLYADAYADRGLARLSQNLDDEAQKDFDKYLELNKDMKDVLEKRIKYAKYQRDKKRKS